MKISAAHSSDSSPPEGIVMQGHHTSALQPGEHCTDMQAKQQKALVIFVLELSQQLQVDVKCNLNYVPAKDPNIKSQML